MERRMDVRFELTVVNDTTVPYALARGSSRPVASRVTRE